MYKIHIYADLYTYGISTYIIYVYIVYMHNEMLSKINSKKDALSYIEATGELSLESGISGFKS